MSEKNTSLKDGSDSRSAEQIRQERDAIRDRIKQQAQQVKIHKPEGEYNFDNPDLEYQTKRQKKTSFLEDKYKDKPKIAFHKLSEEGDRHFIQAQRDYTNTIVGWSLIGSFAAIGVVSYMDSNMDKFFAKRYLQRREFSKVGAFFGTVALFTIYGFGNARQQFVRRKLEIVEDYSIQQSDR